MLWMSKIFKLQILGKFTLYSIRQHCFMENDGFCLFGISEHIAIFRRHIWYIIEKYFVQLFTEILFSPSQSKQNIIS